MTSHSLRFRTAVEAAHEAGAFIKKNLGKVVSVSFKGDINLVTNVDKTSEAIIVRAIRNSFPSDSIVAEEGTGSKGRGAGRWIIDPLDGTTNFFRGFPFFSVSIAYEDEDGVALGIVYDPLRKESFTAERSRGARLNGSPIRVSSVATLQKAFLSTGFAYNVKTARNTNIAAFSRFLKRVLAVRRAGSAALDLAYVACGRFDGFWERNLHPWDCAAGALLVQEAGGKVTSFDRSALNLFGKEILASNGRIHSQMADVLMGRARKVKH